MDPAIYKLIHFIGIFLLLPGLGAYLFCDRPSKLAAVSAGLGLGLILLGGFGMQKHPNIDFSWWFISKLVIWGLLAASIVVAKRRLLPPAVTWILVILLASLAAWLGFSNSLIGRI